MISDDINRDHEESAEERKSENDDFVVNVLKVPAESEKNDRCVICLDAAMDSIFYPCGHQCVCQDCGNQFMQIA